MLYIVILIIVGVSVVLTIVIRKMPELKKISNEPEEAGVRVISKEEIIKKRLKRSTQEWYGNFMRFVGPLVKNLNEKIVVFYTKLKVVKDKHDTYRCDKKSISVSTNVDGLFKRVDEMIDKENWSGAESKLIEIIKIDNKNFEAFVLLGQVYIEQRSYQEAIETFEHAVKIGGDSDEVFYNLAQLYREEGDFNKAFKSIKKALDANSNNPRYLDTAVELAILNKDKIVAIDMFKKLETVNPDNGKLADFKSRIREI